MDYRGQKLCEYIYTILVILFGGVAWIIGYIKNDFVITFYGWAAGLALALVLCIPDWPMYNRNPVTWLNEIGKPNAATKSKSGKSTSAATTATTKKKKN
jgi:signal peptidase complex subunit 1